MNYTRGPGVRGEGTDWREMYEAELPGPEDYLEYDGAEEDKSQCQVFGQLSSKYQPLVWVGVRTEKRRYE